MREILRVLEGAARSAPQSTDLDAQVFAAHSTLAAILDETGIIRAVNAAWTAAAVKNGADTLRSGVGADYLGVCRRALSQAVPGSAQVIAAIERAGAGTLESCEFTYACPTEAETRWFLCRVVPFRLGNRRGVLVTHDDVTFVELVQQAIADAGRRERERLAFDLHDGLGQDLAGASLLLSGVLAERADSEPGLRAELQQVVAILHESIASCRSLAAVTSPADNARGGLAAAVTTLCARLARQYGIAIRAMLPLESVPISDFVADHLYRISQEAVTNAIKHGGARHISVMVRLRPRRLSICVTDDGVGFAVDQPHEGMGLKIMRYRSAVIGAALRFSHRKQRGTRVHLKLSLPAQPAAAHGVYLSRNFSPYPVNSR
jgi:signal transduction histidine kinase